MFLASSAAIATSAMLWTPRLVAAAPRLRVTGIELLPVRATERTVWLIVRLRTDAGLTGLGEASDAFGFANTTKQDAARMESELRGFFSLVDGKSPLDIGAYRQQGEPRAVKGGLVTATAYSAIEQALWDLAGKALDVPTCTLSAGACETPCRSTLTSIARRTRGRPQGSRRQRAPQCETGFRQRKERPSTGSLHQAHPRPRSRLRSKTASPASRRCATRSDRTSS